MEPNPIPSCFLCTESLNEQFQISFTCGHNLCQNCFPFILLDHIHPKSFKKTSSFYLNREFIHKCLICDQGSALISFKSMFKLKNEA